MNAHPIHRGLVLDRRPLRRRSSARSSCWHQGRCSRWRTSPPPNHWAYVQFPAALLVIFALMFVAIASAPRHEQRPDHLWDLTEIVILRIRVLVLVHGRHSRHVEAVRRDRSDHGRSLCVVSSAAGAAPALVTPVVRGFGATRMPRGSGRRASSPLDHDPSHDGPAPSAGSLITLRLRMLGFCRKASRDCGEGTLSRLTTPMASPP